MADRKSRLSIEVEDDEKPLVRQARAAAALKGIPLRQFVMDAIREKLKRER